METLYIRMSLSTAVHHYLRNLQKGYEGEIIFAKHLEVLHHDCIIIHGLLLQVNNITFQIDTLLIIGDTIYLFEVKNYEGNYFYDNDKMYKLPKSEIMNPLNQLKRSETLFKQLIQNWGYHFSVKANVVFVNLNFTLYQAPLNTPFIFPTQISTLLQQLNKQSTKPTGKQKSLAEKLLSFHLEKSPFSQLPKYEFESLQKGMLCKECQSFSLSALHKYSICQKCGLKEHTEDAIMRSIKEYQLLFPSKKITTTNIHVWCGQTPSKSTVYRVLNQHFKKVDSKRWRTYE